MIMQLILYIDTRLITNFKLVIIQGCKIRHRSDTFDST